MILGETFRLATIGAAALVAPKPTRRTRKGGTHSEVFMDRKLVGLTVLGLVLVMALALLVGLKLGGAGVVAGWSWGAVTAPIWLPATTAAIYWLPWILVRASSRAWHVGVHRERQAFRLNESGSHFRRGPLEKVAK